MGRAIVLAQECNFDSIVGLTHNYAGLAYGNVASANHQNQTSYPREAARQGLEKMRLVAELGIPQGVLPPLVRPGVSWLRSLGFEGNDPQVIRQAYEADPVLYAAACSASSMWAANAATVAPSADTSDRRVHFSIANLNSSLHRSLEAPAIEQIFRTIFAGDSFVIHSPLPSASGLTDEGAANHTRLCSDYGESGLQLFVFGRDALDYRRPVPKRFPARQTRQASEALARRHQLNADHVFTLQQSPAAIDAGVFHNDVISVGNQNVLLVHQRAYVDQEEVLQRIGQQYRKLTGDDLEVLQIDEQDLSLESAVSSYLFNSQLLSLPTGGMCLLCPGECQQNDQARAVVERLIGEPGSITQHRYVDLRQSMNNGGGPACLRLRVVLDQRQREQVRGRVWMDTDLYQDLARWIDQFYPESLEVDQLADPELLSTARDANRALQEILRIPLPS